MKKTVYLPFLVFLGLALFLGRGLWLHPRLLPSSQIGKSLPVFTIPELFNPSESFTNQTLLGKISLLNVWASWCSACEEEQAFLLMLAKEEGMPIYGLHYKDTRAVGKQWLHLFGNPYLRIGEDSRGKVAMELGVYGTPETFLIDEKGILLYRHVGVLREDIWKSEFLPRIQKARETQHVSA